MGNLQCDLQKGKLVQLGKVESGPRGPSRTKSENHRYDGNPEKILQLCFGVNKKDKWQYIWAAQLFLPCASTT